MRNYYFFCPPKTAGKSICKHFNLTPSDSYLPDTQKDTQELKMTLTYVMK